MTAQSAIPLKWYVPFAQSDSARVEVPVTSSDPTRASQTLGFPPLTMQPPAVGGVPPQGEDFNGAMNQVARIAWWVLNGGGWPYDATFATNSNIGGYPNGAVLQSADFLGQWISTTDNNQNNPDTVGTGWVPGFQYGSTALTGQTGGTTTLTPLQAAKRSISVAGTLTSALTLVLPAWVKDWSVTNNTTGAFTVTVKTAAGSGVTIPQNGSPTLVAGDGTNITQNAQNIANGTQTNHAVAVGQLYGGLKGIARFTTTGPLVVPTGVTSMWVWGSAGGGAGGSSGTVGSNNIYSGCGGGGAGQWVLASKIAVVPGETLTITIGAGGAVGALNSAGGSGGATTVVGSVSGTLINLTGGSGGAPGLNGAYSSYIAGQAGGAGNPAGAYGQDTGPVGMGAIGGAGASSPFGGGGAPGRGAANANMLPGLAASGYGAGGGGAGGMYAAGNTTIVAATGASGGAGAQGIVIFQW